MPIRSIIGAALLACAVAIPATAQDAPSAVAPPAVATSAKPPPHPTSPVVKITFGAASCTGFYIGNDLFVSAGHCFFETDRPETYMIHPDAGDDVEAAAAVVFDTNRGAFPDVLIIASKRPVSKDWKPETIDCNYVPKVGDEISAVGFPGDAGNGSVFTEGYVNGAPRFMWQGIGGWGVPVIPVSMPVWHGHSGSPAYHDGKVIGIVVGTNPSQADWSYVQPVTPVCDLLGLT